MDPETFSVLRKLAERHTGQRLERAKATLFAARLKRFAFRAGYSDIDDIAKYLDVRDEGSNLDLQIATAMLDRRSRFVPERGLYGRLFEESIGPALAASADTGFRIWFAGCGTGQEVYSMLMMLRNRLAPEQAERVEIVATDISDEALLKANTGYYSHFEVQLGLSAHNLMRYFAPGPENTWRISTELARRIAFKSHNLLDSGEPLGQFDLILCRNVLHEMTDEYRELAKENLEACLRPGGRLYIEP
nr:CheR family methyltransferase [uncultured Hyphomonas sp.]